MSYQVKQWQRVSYVNLLRSGRQRGKMQRRKVRGTAVIKRAVIDFGSSMIMITTIMILNSFHNIK